MTGRRTEPVATGDCRAQLDELFAYLDGELTPARCRTIERHLANCHCCEGLADGVRRAIALCQTVGGDAVPAAVQRKATVRARQFLTQSKRRSRP